VIHNLGGAAMLTVFVVLIFLPLWAIAGHQPIHWAPLVWQLPARDLRSFALFGQMIFGALCGLEYIAILAGESRQPDRALGQSVWISSPIICAMFIFGTSSVSAFVPIRQIDFIAPIPQTLRMALGETGLGNLCAIAAIFLLQLRLIGAASYIFTGATRLPMTAGWDALLPAWFTRLDPVRRTPANSILFTSALVCLLVVLASIGVHAQEAFQVLSNASLTHYELSYLAMFAIPLAGAVTLRRSLPWWLKATSVVGFLATLFSLLIAVYPFVDVVDVRAYAVKIAGTTIASNMVAFSFYRLRSKRARSVASATIVD